MAEYFCDKCEVWFPVWAPERVEEAICPDCGIRMVEV